MLSKFLAILCILSAVRGQSGGECSALPSDAARDCAATEACLQRDQASGILQPISTPSENHQSCYRTCVAANGTEGGPLVCMATSSALPSNTMRVVSGPFHLQQYSLHTIVSPRIEGSSSQLYPNNHLCKYHVKCSDSNSIMSVTVDSLDVEPASQCPPHTDSACLDYVQLDYPTGSQCTLCGSELVCQETGRQIDPLLTLNGMPSLLVGFNSNHKQSGCGFRLLATCISRSFFEASYCTLPPPLVPPTLSFPFSPGFGKRETEEASSHADTTDVRSKRYFTHRNIRVHSAATVMYENMVVKVGVGSRLVYSCQGVRVLQVYNEIEGFLTFYGTANGRSFPGYGVLSIGFGSVHYRQESIPSQYKPTEPERRIIKLLHRGIVDTITAGDIREEGDEPQCASSLTQQQRSEMEREALGYGRACNGFLRAAACAYQQLHMARVTTDCLKDVPFLPVSQTPTGGSEGGS